MNYFKITGLDNGEPIEPYGIETYSAYPHINMGLNHDSVRYYEPITEKDYNELIKNEGGHLQVIDKQDARRYLRVKKIK